MPSCIGPRRNWELKSEIHPLIFAESFDFAFIEKRTEKKDKGGLVNVTSDSGVMFV